MYGGWISFTSHLALKYNYPLYRITKRTVGTARNLSGQSATGSVGRKQQSGGKGDTRFNQGQVQTGNRTPVSEGFRRNIQSLTGATPEQLRSYGLLT